MPTREAQLIMQLKNQKTKRIDKNSLEVIVSELRAVIGDLLSMHQFNRAADLLETMLYSWVCDHNQGYEAYNELVDRYNGLIAQRNIRLARREPAVA